MRTKEKELSLRGDVHLSLQAPFLSLASLVESKFPPRGKAEWRTNAYIGRVQPLQGGWALWCYLLTEDAVSSEKSVSPLSQFIWAMCDLYLANFLLLCSRAHYCICRRFIKLVLLMHGEATSTLALRTSSHPPDAQAPTYHRVAIFCFEARDKEKQRKF